MKTKEQHIDAIMGFTGASELLCTQGIDALARKLDEKGVEKKALQQPPAPADPVVTVKESEEYQSLMAILVDNQAEHALLIEKLQGELEAQQKGYSDKVAALEAEVKDYQYEVVKLRTELELSPKRASQSERTQPEPKVKKALAGMSISKAELDGEEYDPFYPGMNVPKKRGEV